MIVRYFTSRFLLVSLAEDLAVCILLVTSDQPIFLHSCSLHTSPASYNMAVLSTLVDTTAATLNSGLPLYIVISRVPLKDADLISAICTTVWIPLLTTLSLFFENSTL